MLRLTPKTHSVNITYNPKDLSHAFMRYIYIHIHINIFLTLHWKFLWVMCVSASDTRTFSKRFFLLSEKHWFIHVFFSFFPLRQSSAGTFAINLSNISCAPGLGWIVKDSPHISPSRHAAFCLIPTWKLAGRVLSRWPGVRASSHEAQWPVRSFNMSTRRHSALVALHLAFLPKHGIDFAIFIAAVEICWGFFPPPHIWQFV